LQRKHLSVQPLLLTARNIYRMSPNRYCNPPTIDHKKAGKTHFIAEQCLENAALCARMAAEARDPEVGRALSELAMSWSELARLTAHLRK
jgi:hypothetical protein